MNGCWCYWCLSNDLDPNHILTLSGKAHLVIIDGRNIINPDLFINNGFVYKEIGRGDKNMHKILRECLIPVKYLFFLISEFNSGINTIFPHIQYRFSELFF